VCCQYLAVTSKGWYCFGQSRCGRTTWSCMSTPTHGNVTGLVRCAVSIWLSHQRDDTVSARAGVDVPREVARPHLHTVTLRACSVCCRYLAVTSKGWYGFGRSRCGRTTWSCTSTPTLAETVSSLWCDSQILTAHRTSPITLPRNQLLIRYAVTSPVHTVMIRCYDMR